MKIGLVPYLNALPLYHYLDYPVVFGTPVELHGMMERGDIQVALMPSMAFLSHPHYQACFEAGVIQSQGPVDSVVLSYRSHLGDPQNIRSIHYTNESMTSVALFKVIYKNYWKQQLTALQTTSSETADGLLEIGDRALFGNHQDRTRCDLGQVWHEWTGLPFVYALWVTHGDWDPQIKQALIAAKKKGLAHKQDIINQITDFPADKVKDYLTRCIQFEMKPASYQGLERFQKYLFDMGLLKQLRRWDHT